MSLPEADMMAVSKSSRLHRKPGAPLSGLTFMDGDMQKVDKFYNDCQDYRDYYRDSYNKMHCPAAFHTHKGKCGIKLDRSIALLSLPVTWMTEEQPVIYPVEFKRYMASEAQFRMAGRFQKTTDTSFKR
ncbi:uncharacterized protein Dwil_GK18959 [Drosophila willistoni]|uniref:Uncharacterized protein n=1 Tax=Drosophila willistoni TaxID=7260 RepID=B4NI13_DROWI|nr:uncharacterized protein LOC6650663 [Drosophila willistoni]EDW83663.1 uncharacterized protein Dwil_GK18959 [Drosophila willistoni]